MKSSHLTTPRQLSDCQWTGGNLSASPRRNDWAAAIAWALACIAMGLLLAITALPT